MATAKTLSPFTYGFKVHSLSEVLTNAKNDATKITPKKNKKNSPSKSRKQSPEKKASPFSTITSPMCIELFSSSVTQLLDDKHLNASSAQSLHDLQCGTATIALQAFLTYPNLRRVFGIEQNKNLFHFATKNLMNLIKNGYKDNKYLLVEQIPSVKMTIAQKSTESECKLKSFKVGEVVYCFIPLKQKNIKKRDNYQGIVRSINKDGIHYEVEMSVNKTVHKKVHRESMFKPGTERTFEIARGNLFERSDSFRSDILLLPYSISNDSFRSLLLTGCKRSPINSRILSFHHLELWDGFPEFQLRRVDANVYDNDRYDTNLSPHQRLFMYQHVLSHSQASSPSDIRNRCKVGSRVTVRDLKQQHWFAAKVISINEKNKSLTVSKDGFLSGTEVESIGIDEQRVHLIDARFRSGDLVSLYCPKMIETQHENMYNLYRGQVIGCNENGSYCVQYEDGETVPKVDQCYLFKRNAPKYAEGQLCIASRYDGVKEVDDENNLINVKQLYKNGQSIDTNECIIRHINPDGTYRVEFINLSQYLLHDSFCESWLIPFNGLCASSPSAASSQNGDSVSNGNKKTLGDDEKNTLQQQQHANNILSMIEPKLPLVFEIDYDRVLQWKPNIVCHWFKKCGINEKSADILQKFEVNGVFLFDLDMDLLNECMGINKNDCIQILRYMRALRSKLQYNLDEEDEEMTQISLQIQQFDAQIRKLQKEEERMQMKFESIVSANGDEYAKYKEWTLKRQCVEMKNKKMSKKDIAAQLKKPNSWVNKVFKLKQNQIRKPNGNIIKQIEEMQTQILKNSQKMEEKQSQMIAARQKLHKFLAD